MYFLIAAKDKNEALAWEWCTFLQKQVWKVEIHKEVIAGSFWEAILAPNTGSKTVFRASDVDADKTCLGGLIPGPVPGATTHPRGKVFPRPGGLGHRSRTYIDIYIDMCTS